MIRIIITTLILTICTALQAESVVARLTHSEHDTPIRAGKCYWCGQSFLRGYDNLYIQDSLGNIVDTVANIRISDPFPEDIEDPTKLYCIACPKPCRPPFSGSCVWGRAFRRSKPAEKEEK